MLHIPVAIVGGGLAGLYAAHELRRAGVVFELFEARDRLGGRILSVDAAGAASVDGFDLGPSWFWPAMHPQMAELVRELGLSAFPQHDAGDIVVERFQHGAPQRFRAMRQEPASMRVAGGMGALAAALAGTLSADRVHIDSRVTHLAMAEMGVTLTLMTSGGTVRTLDAEQVLLALPPRLLADTIGFAPAIDPQTLAHWHDTAAWMAPHAKFFALYDRPFWREAGLSGDAQSMVGPLVEIHDATTAEGRAALFGFVGLDAAQRAAMGEKALATAAVAQLVRLFGSGAAHPSATLVKDWAADPLTATPADQVASGHPVASGTPWIAGAWADRARLAGSETSVSDPGYLAGAIEAGGRAAKAVQARLRAPAGKETIAC